MKRRRAHFPREPRMSSLLRENLRLARQQFGGTLPVRVAKTLEMLSRDFNFSFSNGEMQFINSCCYVTHTGLLRLARRKRCSGIHVETVDSLCDWKARRFVLKATVFPSKGSSGFSSYGDADPSNISPLVSGAEIRVAETRAVNRALRKTYGIGLCSVEEIGTNPSRTEKLPTQNASGSGNGTSTGPKVRDRLCQIIRQYKLDPELIKAYAVDFCGTKTLRDASRQQMENFVQRIVDWVEKDRDALLCQLNSYARPKQEVVL